MQNKLQNKYILKENFYEISNSKIIGIVIVLICFLILITILIYQYGNNYFYHHFRR